jgi:hypothetical protein
MTTALLIKLYLLTVPVFSSSTGKNTFRMPALIEPDEAAGRIMRELDKPSFEITFP